MWDNFFIMGGGIDVVVICFVIKEWLLSIGDVLEGVWIFFEIVV